MLLHSSYEVLMERVCRLSSMYQFGSGEYAISRLVGTSADLVKIEFHELAAANNGLSIDHDTINI